MDGFLVLAVLRELLGGVDGRGLFRKSPPLVVDLGQGHVGIAVVLAVEHRLGGGGRLVVPAGVGEQRSAHHLHHTVVGILADGGVRLGQGAREVLG